MLTKRRIFTTVCSLFILFAYSSEVFAKKSLGIVEWQSPAPSITDLNLNYDVVADMIG